jgi:hypothetical protein
VELQGGNAKRVVYGALNLRSGHRTILTREGHTAVDFQFFLWQLRSEYRGWNIHLLLDEHKSHRDQSTEALLKKMNFCCHWLPIRSPKLNPMDHLWGKAKGRISANLQYETIDDAVEKFTEYVQTLSNYEALIQAGVLSDKFWLKQALSTAF